MMVDQLIKKVEKVDRSGQRASVAGNWDFWPGVHKHYTKYGYVSPQLKSIQIKSN